MIALALLALPFYFALIVVLNGWVITILWSWFIVPTFGLITLSIPQALGVSVIVSYFTYQDVKTDSDHPLPFLIAKPFVKMGFALGIGYIITLFM